MCLKPLSPPLMASQSVTPKPLNPNAQPFYTSLAIFPYQHLGFPQLLYAPPQIPSTYPPPPPNSLQLLTYHHSLTFFTNPKPTPRWSHSHRYKKYPSPPRTRWIPKQRPHHHHSVIPFPPTAEEAHNSAITTVMIKNIPYHYEREDLLSMLDDYCVKQNASAKSTCQRCMYDFVYLPMDYKKAQEAKKSNLGYAFVNFTTPGGAFGFYEEFNGQKWAKMEKWKACEVTKAQFQGKELRSRFERKTFRCVCPRFRPVEYRPARDGVNNERVKEIWVGNYAKGLPNTSIGRSRKHTIAVLCFHSLPGIVGSRYLNPG
ncbi:Protein terminal ear1 [Senna tora]|uniref:Protein terminal ear1 n=1 Tax=Senna tora TaxID=362788 RepID=A0A834TYV0_9FABA|nr:Protein terminal ear1 [Senna tora]